MPNQLILKIDSSQIKTFLVCPQKWYYEYFLSIARRDRKRVSYFDTGSYLHGMLDIYYKNWVRMGHFDAAQYSINIAKQSGSLTPEEVEFCQVRFSQYVTFWQANEFIPAIIGGRPQVELGFSKVLYESPQYLFILEGRIDLITNQGLFVDHKSQKRAYDHYKFDPQFISYAWAMNMKNGMINYIGTQDKLHEKSFRRMTLAFSSAQLKHWEERLKEIFFSMAGMIQTKKFNRNETECNYCPYNTLCETIEPQILHQLINIQYEPVPRWVPWTFSEKTGEEMPTAS